MVPADQMWVKLAAFLTYGHAAIDTEMKIITDAMVVKSLTLLIGRENLTGTFAVFWI